MLLAFESGLRPAEFWDMSWLEFDLWVKGYERKVKNDWAQSSEIMAGLWNLFSLHTTKPGRVIKTYSGNDINPFTETQQQPTSTLPDFKGLCKKLGIPWNPVTN